jgi:hypothetical protein
MAIKIFFPTQAKMCSEALMHDERNTAGSWEKEIPIIGRANSKVTGKVEPVRNSSSGYYELT